MFTWKQEGLGIPLQFPNQLMTIPGVVSRGRLGETWETKQYLITGHLLNTTDNIIPSWVEAGAVH